MSKKLRLAFVTPWYGANILGGAEFACRSLVKNLSKKSNDISVEILTTCVKDFNSNWNKNYHKPGMELINDIPVRRFRVRTRNTKIFNKINYKLMNNLPITLKEEEVFLQEMINSPELYKFIGSNFNKYDFYVFIPYMFGTTYWGIQACPEKSVLIPCLHDESYAYMQSFQQMFSLLKGKIFLSAPEYELAQRLYGMADVNGEVIGLGLETNLDYSTQRFFNKYNINEPFILYAGRKDQGKNVDELISYFIRYKYQVGSDIKLILIGGGDIAIPRQGRDCIIDLGFISLQDKYDAMAAAKVLCQPSLNESFSLVIMESWICGTPVLINERCNVTGYFCKASNGGLYYRNYSEFAECLNILLGDDLIADTLGKQGRSFVLKNFSWDTVIRRYTDFFKSLL